MDNYFTIRIRVNDGLVTGVEASPNTPCILADDIARTARSFYNRIKNNQ
jgi:hypothetical protein